MLRILAIKGGSNLLADHSHQMNRAISKIDDLLRVSKGKGSIGGEPDMASIGTGGGVPKRDAGASALYWISPAKPPFPTPSNFPFQPEAGIQISILMSESLVGFNLAATRQNAGMLVKVSPFGAL